MGKDNNARVGVGIAGSTAVVRLENPGQFNALTKDMCLQLVGAFAGLATNDEVASIVVRGAGGNFCAGIAIDEMDQVLFDRDEDGELINHFDLLDKIIMGCPKPTIAVVEGNCFGGAWQLASACDIQLASDNVRIAITSARIGLVFPRPGIDRLVRAVGEHRAKYLLLSGAEVSIAEAERWGMFTKVVSHGQLEEQLDALLGQLAANSPYSISRTKEAINLVSAGEATDSWWETLWEENGANADLAEGRSAFLARRTPDYSGLRK
ncbi:enoyl-CoA hydratase/isomerase family protein [Glutamicibacter nicotianae]|uniref:enoyl-CoA hydratase/isomerase family protein n=1 Tax=Glutamicibacter nicotianae TaxID=37929 RepID=UPI00167F3BC7|nr:enoyl-CoA hydratase/isomerase family protein [Glutamicibacter nicotianae]